MPFSPPNQKEPRGGGARRSKGGFPSSGSLLPRPSFRRLLVDKLALAGMLVAVALVVIPVVLILYHITSRGMEAMSWEFLTQPTPYSFRREGGGFLNGLIGTAIMVGLATAFAVPLGILAAVYLVEYGGRNVLGQLIRFFSDVMTGVPSVFVGLFVYTAFVVPFGFGAIMGAFALAIIMMPIVVRSTEEMLKLVPMELKAGSYALGATRWQTILLVIIPSALPGIVTGVLLAVARAAGETAPLILTALGSLRITTSLVGEPISALPLLIFDGARNPFPAGQARAWAGALELLFLVLVLTLIARLIASRSRIS
jgi:phosphate transport system permease protein